MFLALRSEKKEKAPARFRVNKAGFRKEQDLEDYIFSRLKEFKADVYRQQRFLSSEEMIQNSIPDIIVEEEKRIQEFEYLTEVKYRGFEG